jgi:hypothetical protein
MGPALWSVVNYSMGSLFHWGQTNQTDRIGETNENISRKGEVEKREPFSFCLTMLILNNLFPFSSYFDKL